MIRRALEWFGGSVLVYLGVAACSASGGMQDLMEIASGGLMGSGAEKGSGAAQGSGATSQGSGAEGAGAMSQGSGAEGPMGSGAVAQGSGSQGQGGSILDPVPEAEAAEDGTRIVNLYWTTADGLKTADGYWDKDLGVQCYFGVAEDLAYRCLPSNLSGINAAYYSNDTCTVRVGYTSKGNCPAAAYLTAATFTSGCGQGPLYYHTAVYEIGTKLTGPVVYSGTPESCTEVSQTFYDNYDFYQLTKLPATLFAEGTLVQGG